MAAKKKLSFEEGMEALDALVRRMETGDMPLEASFDAYEQAQTLLKQLTEQLDAGEARMAELTASGEAPLTVEEA